MFRHLLYSRSLVLSYYFVISIIMFLAINFVHQIAIKRHDRESRLEREIIASEQIQDQLLKEGEDGEEQPAKEEDEFTRNFVISPGDTLIGIFEQANLEYNEAIAVVDSLKNVYNPRKINIGTEIQILFEPDKMHPENKTVNKIIISPGSNKKIEIFHFGEANYQAKIIELPMKKFLVKKTISIDGSFIGSTSKNGIPSNIILSVVKSLSYDVDFQRDIKKGDIFDIIYEKYYNENGKFSHYGGVKYANLKLHEVDHKIYKHINLQGEESFYDYLGRSVVKSLLRTPVNAARISSGFGVRKHPVLGYSKMHKGVDFAAPVGTPILAAGSGVVEYRGEFSTYGNYLKIRHNNIYSTAYAHISKFASGIKVGSRVKQGQVIAYVGLTGRTTGAHLHYEVLKQGQQINPNNMKLTSIGNKLAGKELKRFQDNVNKIEQILKKQDIDGETASSNNF